MYKKIIILQIVFILTNLSLQDTDDETCNINISHNRVQDQIVKYGKLTENWELTPYKATPDAVLEYFYTLQITNMTAKAPVLVKLNSHFRMSKL
jgi:hypothetical protein